MPYIWPRTWRRELTRGLLRASCVAAGVSLLALLPVGAQTSDSSAVAGSEGPLFWLVSTEALERHRLDQLVGKGAELPTLLRSTSTLLSASEKTPQGFVPILPEVQVLYNSTLPFSVNNGAMWGGRGLNTRIIGGVHLWTPRVRVVLAPELVTSANDSFSLSFPIIERPPIPPDRSPWQFQWYAYGPYSIDMPTRFGNQAVRRLHPGQSSIAVGLGALEVGAATENQWWGPGIANALVLSNNAPGFFHLFFRSAKPLRTAVGDVDFRWIVGGLRESRFFDTLETNDLRSIAAAGVTLSLRRPAGLTIGAARSVWGTSTGWGEVPGRWFEVFHGTGRPSNRALSDSSLYPGGREQIYSLFARWVFPSAGLETYAEWGRTEFPVSIRDALAAPNHSQAYTVGLQWRRPGFREGDFWRVHGENTSVEQSATFRERPLGVWYTSRQVIQGYTNEGQPLGAAVGPGSSGQIISIDYFRPRVSFGIKAGRMRINEDVRSISDILWFKRWCTHDINLYGGPRVSAQTRAGLIAAEFTLAHRIQPWFQVQSGCPRGDAMHDYHNSTVTLTFSPRRNGR